MKRTLLALALLLASLGVRAQVNIQEMYDVNRGHFTTTLEMFKTDKWGSTFFFNDIYHTDNFYPTDYYTEIARSLNFWQNTKLAPLSLHIEWNGGNGTFPIYGPEGYYGHSGYGVNNAWLFGLEYFLHNANYNNTLTLQVLYKNIRLNEGIYNYPEGKINNVPMQLTAVWGMKDLFGVKGLVFSGFIDFWWENHNWGNSQESDWTSTVLLAEPQLWYNLGQHFKCENLFIGGELEISNNFGGNASFQKGWDFNPAVGIKWNF